MPPGRPDNSRSLYLARKPYVTGLLGAAEAARAAQVLDPVSTRRDLTEDAFLRAAVAMENFFTEWIVRCVAMDSTTLRTTLENKASNYLKAELPRWRSLPEPYRSAMSAAATIPIPPTLSQEKVRELLGCETDNLSVHGVSDLHTYARENIADRRGVYLSKLTTGEAKVVDATIAIRNFLVHRTERARTQLNESLQAGGMPQALRRNANLGSGDSVGRYLCVKTPAGNYRFEELLEALRSVAVKLAPYPGAPTPIC